MTGISVSCIRIVVVCIYVLDVGTRMVGVEYMCDGY